MNIVVSIAFLAKLIIGYERNDETILLYYVLIIYLPLFKTYDWKSKLCVYPLIQTY